jgi:polyisoprenyl-teichoic acid--peptidoglycan teichoic acid transferase
MSPKRRLFTGMVATLTAAALTWTALGTATPASGQDPAAEIHEVHRAKPRPPTLDEPIFILVMGGDARTGNPEKTRVDAISIVGIDPVAGKASILGIPRDSWVDIPGYGTNKINAAGVFGGPDLMVETVEKRSGCRFDYYALTNFAGFRTLIDDLGGIRMDIEQRLFETRGSRIDLQPGRQTLDGKQALAFARLRKTSARPLGDISRSAAHGELMVAMLGEMRRDFTKSPGALLRALASIHKHLALNISLADTMRLGQAVLRIEQKEVTTAVVNSALDSVNGISIVRITDSGSAQFVDICSDGLLGS